LESVLLAAQAGSQVLQGNLVCASAFDFLTSFFEEVKDVSLILGFKVWFSTVLL